MPSTASTLCLHGVRLLGASTAEEVAARFGLDPESTREELLDLQAVGMVTATDFAGVRHWSLTDAGRAENERQLAAELDACGGREAVTQAHAKFVLLNETLLKAATDWQLRPMPGDPLAANDHTDFRWDDRVIERLASVGRQLHPIGDLLSGVLVRFDGYPSRFDVAFERVQAGQASWVDSIEVDSCHVVWMQLHEDLLATLGHRRDHAR